MNGTDSVMSAEPGRRTAYSNDLRWRIVYQSDEPATRENSAKLKRSGKYSAPYIPIV